MKRAAAVTHAIARRYDETAANACPAAGRPAARV